MEKNREIAIKIIDLFEDLLNRKNIVIPNKNRENNGSQATIYGNDYYELEDEITEILDQYISDNEIVKIGFDGDKCFKIKNVIIGRGIVYYYDSEEEYDRNEEKEISLFAFKYDIQKEEIIKVRCKDETSKYHVENNTDDFIDNIKINLIPKLVEEVYENVV